jgi:predicted CopG family antitoxin
MVSFGISVPPEIYEWLQREKEERGGASIASIIRQYLRLAFEASQTDPASEAYVKRLCNNEHQ